VDVALELNMGLELDNGLEAFLVEFDTFHMDTREEHPFVDTLDILLEDMDNQLEDILENKELYPA
jgi:hypothetical protein